MNQRLRRSPPDVVYTPIDVTSSCPPLGYWVGPGIHCGTRSLHAFQIVSAETNVYFSDWTHKDRLTDLVLEKRHLRSTDATVLEEFESDADKNDSLVHFYAEPPNLGLNLSFLQVKKRASRVSMGSSVVCLPELHRFSEQAAQTIAEAATSPSLGLDHLTDRAQHGVPSP